MSKKLKNLTSEELLLSLEETSQDKAKKTDVYQYILDSEFKIGSKLIPNAIIYYKYTTSGKYKDYNRRAFFRLFSNFFKSVSPSAVRGYRLDSNLVVTEEDITNARILTRREQYEKTHQKRGRKGWTQKKKETDEIKDEEN